MFNIRGLGGSKQNKGESSEEHNIGLNQITYPKKPKADIVFVHGLGGDAYSTWEFKGKNPETTYFWPKGLLGDDLNCRVWSYGYHAKKFSIEKGHAASRYDQAKMLLEHLLNNNLFQQPLFFIAHSLGGLVVKEMLQYAQNEKQEILNNKVKGIVFLSTPHDGANLATIIKNLNINVASIST